MKISNEEFEELKRNLPEVKDYNFSILDLDCNVDEIIDFIWKNPEFQNPKSSVYYFFKNLLILKYAALYKVYDEVESIFDIKINFPFISLGNINSRHFFGIDELLIYKFYKNNVDRYKKVCDIGTNVGLHSKILCELNYSVDSYEPDIVHSKIAKNYLDGYSNNNFHQKAVSSYEGKAQFTKIINNSTGSYINDKKESYGPTEVYEVEVVNAEKLAGKFDLFKLDVEGSEVDILKSFQKEDFDTSDFIAEISTEPTREEFWNLFSSLKIPVYAQKISWGKVESIEDLPTSHREGSIFISKNNTWY